MDLSHAQAREMIQFNADSPLNADSLRILKSHLAACEACCAYADSIHAMEVQLRHAMNRRWNIHPAPLAVDAIRSSKQRPLVATRFAVVASAILMFVVVTLGIANTTKVDGIPQTPLGVPLIPTPSLQTTNTITNTSQVCEQIRYEVQPDDTFESIAHKFSISKNDLMDANNMSAESVISGTELIIPLCNSTPTGTVHPPTFTTTITPLTEVISDTPDG
ncbi:MAG TPA: LysM peptidoglycan-binding domain-containing protein [Anaerolineales bacterium]|nr:LysM peptidoglycan-binding domain-containing protein [Anaerolineales bacterium]